MAACSVTLQGVGFFQVRGMYGFSSWNKVNICIIHLLVGAGRSSLVAYVILSVIYVHILDRQ